MSLEIEIAERGLAPDAVIRQGIRRMLARNLAKRRARAVEVADTELRRFLAHMGSSPVAVHTDAANEQHYEVPPRFFELALGKRLKYSSAYFAPGEADLDHAEEAMLTLSCKRADLRDGLDILELGCGWGSLTLWMAEHYPHARITAVSNSAPQRKFIEARAAKRGFANVRVITTDMNELELPEAAFDRVVSVEMFEHMRNWPLLLSRIATWMRDDARMFLHIFTHREDTYPFEVDGQDDWLSKYFFTGGLMPGDSLIYRFHEHLVVDRHWRVDGRHYESTANCWLQNQDAHRAEILRVFRDTYGEYAPRWFHRWRLFFMACAELWGYDGGREWMVSHYRLKKR